MSPEAKPKSPLCHCQCHNTYDFWQECCGLVGKENKFRIKEEITIWRNMVAVLCGDGGHYLEEHGPEKTKQYIENRVFELRRKVKK